jgi:hypothetical protein
MRSFRASSPFWSWGERVKGKTAFAYFCRMVFTGSDRVGKSKNTALLSHFWRYGPLAYTGDDA